MTIIPVHNMTVLPRSVLYIQTGIFAKSVERPAEVGEKVVLLFTKEDDERAVLTNESFKPLAVTGIIRNADLSGFVAIETLDRVGIDSVYVTAAHKIQLEVSPRPEI